MRFLKILKAFLEADMSWTEGSTFQIFMSCVIAINGVVMSLELDIAWAGWVYVENIFMVIYVFEVAVRLRHLGRRFFWHETDMFWNVLDFIIVSGGVVDLWLLPSVIYLQGIFFQKKKSFGHRFGKMMSIVRLMRIMRVLRLVKLLRSIRPLYSLLLGVMESLNAMKWVLSLTLVLLYACSIVFTSLVSQGLMRADEPNVLLEEGFGTTLRSLFSLFRVMNGDVTVIGPLCTTVAGQLSFVVFMVISNWTVLAVLTSVVCDHMITASNAEKAREDGEEAEEEQRRRAKQLEYVFKRVDTDRSGSISEEEWNDLLRDPALCADLCDAANLEENDLRAMFQCWRALGKEDCLAYDAFVDHLKVNTTLADRRSILLLIALIRDMEVGIERRFGEMMADHKASTKGRWTAAAAL
jgi:voltage-gated sodium channel